jgi:hypothetical protein
MRVDNWGITVTIDGFGNIGVFDKMTGGDIDSEETKYKPGGMGASISLGGSQTPGNCIVSRFYDYSRDNALCKHLLGVVGKVQMSITKSPMDPDGNYYQDAGASLVYTGTLKRVTPPEPDSEGTGAAMLEIEMSTAGVVG